MTNVFKATTCKHCYLLYPLLNIAGMYLSLSKLPPSAQVAVVGGGVSGLGFTYFLSKLRPDVKITLIESSNRFGGYINSNVCETIQGTPVMLEKGPRTLRGVSDGTVMIVDMLRDLGERNSVQYIKTNSEANKKFLLDTNNRLLQVPNSVYSAIKFLGNPLGKGLINGLLGEFFRKGLNNYDVDESAHSLISRRFGNEHISENILSSIFHGIYAGDINQLSAKMTLNSLVNMEKNYGSITKALIGQFVQHYADSRKKGQNLSGPLLKYQNAFSKDQEEILNLKQRLKKYPMLGLQGGLETFPKALSERIMSLPNITFLTETRIEKVNKNQNGKMELHMFNDNKLLKFDHVRFTINSKNINDITNDIFLKNKLDQIKSATIILVNFYFLGKDLIKPYHGFGYLVPKSNTNCEKLLGVIFDSVIEKNFHSLFGDTYHEKKQYEYTKLTAMFGGHYLNTEGPHHIPSNSVIIQMAEHVFKTHLNISPEDLNNGHWDVSIHQDCLPQYHVGYNDLINDIYRHTNEEYMGSLSLGGMLFSKGPGVPDVIINAFEDALLLS